MSSPLSHVDNVDDRSDNRFQWSDRSLQALFEAAIDVLIIVDSQGYCLGLNPAACDLIGLSYSGFLRQSLSTWLDWTAWDDLPAPHIFEAIAQGSSFDDPLAASPDMQLQRVDGSERRVTCAIRWMESEQSYLVLLRDVTKQRQANAQLQTIAHALQSVARRSPTGAIAEQSQKHPHVPTCSRLCNQFGEEPPASKSKTAPTMNSAVSSETHPATNAANHRPQESLDRKSPNPLTLQCSTERLFQAVFNQTFQLSSLLTPDGVVLQDNQTALEFCQLSHDEIVGHAFWELPCWSVSATVQAQLKQAIAQAAAGDTVRYGVEIAAPDHSTVAIDFSLKPMRNEQGEVELLIAEGRDITHYCQLEASLRASQQKYQTIFETLPLGLSVTDAQGQVIEANQASESILGVSLAGQMLGHGYEQIQQIICPDGTPMATSDDASIRALRENRLVSDTEMGLVQADGSTRWVSITAAPIPLDNYGVAIAYSDITQRKQAELALQESEQRLRNVLETVPLVAVMMDREGQILLCSNYLLELTGWSRADVIGYNWFERFLPAEDRESIRHSVFDRAFSATDYPSCYENEILTREGDRRLIAWHKTIFRNTSGTAVSITAIGQDITEQKQAEATLRRSEEIFRALFQQASLGIALSSSQGILLAANSKLREILGRTEAELLHHSFQEFTAAEDLPLNLQYQQELLAGQRKSYAIEKRYVRKDGSQLWCNVSVTLLWDVAGQPNSIMAIVEDINERKELETALRESEALMDSVMANAVACITRFRGYSDRTFVYDYCSDGAEAVFGYTADELLEHPNLWLSHIHPDDLQQILTTAFDHIFQEEDYRAEYRFLAADGSYRWIVSTLSSTYSSNSNCWFVTAVDMDITERKQAALELKSSHQRYKDLMNSTEGVVWEADVETFMFTFVSDRAEHLLGYPTEQWLGDPDFWPRHIHPEDRDWAIAFCISETQQCSNHDFEYRMIAADGRVVWVRDLVTVQTEQGVPKLLRGLIIDVTAQKEAEEALQQYERIVSATPDGVALLNRDYVYQVVNQSYLTWNGKDRNQIIGHSVAELLGQEVFEQVSKPRLDRALAGEIVRYQEWFTFDTLGQQFIDVTYAPYIDGRGQIAGVVALSRNLTDLKQAEIALQRLAEQELLLIGITNHIRRSLDLNTILETAVAEVRQMLQVDRVLVYRFATDSGGQVIAESVADNDLSLMGYIINDPCLEEKYRVASYDQSGVHNVTDIDRAKHLIPCYVEMLRQLQVRANLVLPIVYEERVWGLLIAQNCTQPRYWQHGEVDLLKQLTLQLAIAIQQSELYAQVQHLNDNLELEVAERTTDLRQALDFEALLKRITDKVRDSLDESQILQAVVEELAHGLEIKCCDTGIYNADRTTSTITHEVSRSHHKLQGTTFTIAESRHPEIYPFLFQGQTCQFSDCESRSLFSARNGMTTLACPITDDQQAIGDLWLYKSSTEWFSESEVRLVRQVTNQCAIALRQARLYQAAQNQVAELERLNQLKDDFLSTVSHELRTPMATIKMALQMIEMQLEQQGLLEHASDTLLDRYIQILRDECQREANLINNLLDLTRLDANTEPNMPIEIALKPWVAHIAESFLPRMEQQQQTFSSDIPTVLTIEADLTYLERILSELFNNACKYTPANESIRVVAQRLPTGNVQLTVSNTGVEVPPVECDRMFDKFYRIPNNDPWEHGGTGLGLALVKKLAHQLNATIRAESGDRQLHFILEFQGVSKASAP